MRILMFTGIQLPAVTGQKLTRAGWQEGLRKALFEFYPNIDLHIASFGPEKYQPIKSENATYYNILRENIQISRMSRVMNNWRHSTLVDSNELAICRNLINEIKPDLILIFGTENPFGLIANQVKIPVIISIQSVLNGLVNRIFYGMKPKELIDSFISKDNLIGQGVYHQYWQMRKQARVEKQIYNRCDFFIGRTEWDKQWVNKLNPQAKYFHVDEVLSDNFYNIRWDITKTKGNYIFTTSSNAPFKGGNTLARGFLELVKRGREDVSLGIAGVDPSSVVGKNINHLISKNNLSNRVKMFGRITPKKIINEMKKARVFILPSHMDNSPNSLAEAMLLGMPCIASNAGGIQSMLTDGYDGLIYHHTDIIALADKVEQVIDNPALAQELGSNSRITAQRRHDPKIVADTTINVFNQIMELRASFKFQE